MYSSFPTSRYKVIDAHVVWRHYDVILFNSLVNPNSPQSNHNYQCLFDLVKRITGSRKKRKKQTRVTCTVPYFLLDPGQWLFTCNMDILVTLYYTCCASYFNIFIHLWTPRNLWITKILMMKWQPTQNDKRNQKC